MNHVVLMGNLTDDPKVRPTSNGKPVVEWTLAVNERWKTASGEEKERCSFVGCYAWGPKGEAFARFHRKGAKALVEGKLVQETWEKDGKKQSRTRLQVSEFHFVGGPKGEASQPQPKPATPQPKVLPTEADQPAEDDVPF